MSDAMKSLTLRKRVQGPWMNAPAEIDYVVIESRNTTSFSPGDSLTSDYVETLCDDPEWDVVINANGF